MLAGTNHVEINVNDTAMQMLVGFDSSGVITILPERPVSILALVIFLRSAPGDELHTLGNDVWPCVSDEQVNVITCHHVIEHAQSEALFGFEKPVEITAPITCSEIQTSNIER